MSDFVQTLASAVRRHRKSANLTQSQLAKFAGVGKTVIFDIEHAKATVKLQTVLQVLSALNISLTLSSPLLTALAKDSVE